MEPGQPGYPGWPALPRSHLHKNSTALLIMFYLVFNMRAGTARLGEIPPLLSRDLG